MIKLVEMLFSRAGGIALGAALVVSIVVGFAAEQRRIGAAKATGKIERTTHAAGKALSAAADRSRDPGVRGKVDPSTRDD